MYKCDGNECRLVTDSDALGGPDSEPLPDPLEDGFTIYGTKSCPYCVRAYNVLKRGPYIFNYISLDKHAGWREEIKRRSGHQTVPVIYHYGRLVGGYNNLLTFLSP